jgi:hypothetical protein
LPQIGKTPFGALRALADIHTGQTQNAFCRGRIDWCGGRFLRLQLRANGGKNASLALGREPAEGAYFLKAAR